MDKGEDGDSHVIDLSEHFSPNNEAQSFPIGIRSIHTTETEIIVNRSWTIIQLKEKVWPENQQGIFRVSSARSNFLS